LHVTGEVFMDHENGQNGQFILYARRVLGIVLIVVGILGLFLPFLQGIAMILAGITLIGGRPALRKCKRLAMQLLRLWRRLWR